MSANIKHFTTSTGLQLQDMPSRLQVFAQNLNIVSLPYRAMRTGHGVMVNTARSNLWSASSHDLMHPWTNMLRYGQHSFDIIGPRTWNQLPPDIRDPLLILANFCRRLKTVLFKRAYYAF